MFNLFKKSYKSKFAKKLERATQHKMFEGCKFRCIADDTAITYNCDNEELGKYMTKKLLAECLQKKILCFKMGVKGCSANVGSLYDLTNGDLFILLF